MQTPGVASLRSMLKWSLAMIGIQTAKWCNRDQRFLSWGYFINSVADQGLYEAGATKSAALPALRAHFFDTFWAQLTSLIKQLV